MNFSKVTNFALFYLLTHFLALEEHRALMREESPLFPQFRDAQTFKMQTHQQRHEIQHRLQLT